MPTSSNTDSVAPQEGKCPSGYYLFRGVCKKLPETKFNKALLQECLDAASSIEEAAERYFRKAISPIAFQVEPLGCSQEVKHVGGYIVADVLIPRGYRVITTVEYTAHRFVGCDMEEHERSSMVFVGETYDSPPTPEQLAQEKDKCYKPVWAYNTEKLKQLLELFYFDVEGGYDEADIVDHLLICGFSWPAQLADPEAAEMIKAAKKKFCEQNKMLAAQKLQELFEALVAGRPVGTCNGRPVKVTVNGKQARVCLSSRCDFCVIEELFAIFGKELSIHWDRSVEEDTDLCSEVSSALSEFERAEEELKELEGIE